MGKTKPGQAGFSAVELVIVVVVLVLLGVVGYVVYKNHHKSATPTLLYQNNPAAPKTPSATNSYSGWKSYCDTIDNGCFKYPSNWELTTSDIDGQTSVQVSSPGETATATYKTLPATIVTPQSSVDFYAVSTNAVSTVNANLKVVGGYFTSSNIPYYYLVEASSLSTYPLTTDQTSQFEAIPDYNLMNSTNFGSFYAYDSQKGPAGAAAQAQAWYSTSDAQDSLLVVQSFYYL